MKSMQSFTVVASIAKNSFKAPASKAGLFINERLSRPEIAIHKKSSLWKDKSIMLSVRKKITP